MIRKRVISILAAMTLLLLASCGPAPVSGTADPATANDAKPVTEHKPSGAGVTDFSLKDIDGKTHSLSDYLGEKVILISFWATWCEPCKKEMVQLSELYEANKDKGFLVMSISMDEPESQGDVRPYIKQRGYSFPVLLDSEGEVTNLLNPKRAAPFTLIIDKNQNVSWEHESYVPGDEIKIEEAVMAALGTPSE